MNLSIKPARLMHAVNCGFLVLYWHIINKHTQNVHHKMLTGLYCRQINQKWFSYTISSTAKERMKFTPRMLKVHRQYKTVTTQHNYGIIANI